jgi:4-alpha-glucanotransferase
MGKRKTKAEQTAQTAKELEDMCLHCAFFTLHGDKWPEWRADGDNVSQDAFNDLVRSTVKIVAEVFTMLAPLDQVQFMSKVMTSYREMQGGSGESASAEDIKEFATALHNLEADPTKH